MNLEREKIIAWFIDDLNEQLAWTDADDISDDISDEMVLKIAKKKTDDLINSCSD